MNMPQPVGCLPEVMTVENLIKVITDLGFPIFVSLYLMIELSGRMRSLENAITNLSAEIALLREVMDGGAKSKAGH